jgi:cytochrome c oxidase cbb3-type subunit 3
VALKYSIIGIVVAIAVVAAAAWTVTSRLEPEQRISLNYPEGVAAVVPLGIGAGAVPPLAVSTDNPLSSNPTAVQEGKKLFSQMNCAGCHGYDAKGGMGPDLTDTAWRYGGTPIDIYKSIYEGRPQGMPAWGNTLPPNTLWQLVAYIQSLGGSFSAPPPGVQQAEASAQGQGAQAGQRP